MPLALCPRSARVPLLRTSQCSLRRCERLASATLRGYGARQHDRQRSDNRQPHSSQLAARSEHAQGFSSKVCKICKINAKEVRANLTPAPAHNFIDIDIPASCNLILRSRGRCNLRVRHPVPPRPAAVAAWLLDPLVACHAAPNPLQLPLRLLLLAPRRLLRLPASLRLARLLLQRPLPRLRRPPLVCCCCALHSAARSGANAWRQEVSVSSSKCEQRWKLEAGS